MYRQRYAHEAAKIATCKSSSQSNSTHVLNNREAEINDITSVMESWVPIEHCIFESVINDIRTDDETNTLNNIQETFNDVVKEFSNIKGLENIASMKTLNDITHKLSQRDSDVTEYLNLYQIEETESLEI